jgi:hypothetical protein
MSRPTARARSPTAALRARATRTAGAVSIARRPPVRRPPASVPPEPNPWFATVSSRPATAANRSAVATISPTATTAKPRPMGSTWTPRDRVHRRLRGPVPRRQIAAGTVTRHWSSAGPPSAARLPPGSAPHCPVPAQTSITPSAAAMGGSIPIRASPIRPASAGTSATAGAPDWTRSAIFHVPPVQKVSGTPRRPAVRRDEVHENLIRGISDLKTSSNIEDLPSFSESSRKENGMIATGPAGARCHSPNGARTSSRGHVPGPHNVVTISDRTPGQSQARRAGGRGRLFGDVDERTERLRSVASEAERSERGGRVAGGAEEREARPMACGRRRVVPGVGPR